MDTTAIEAELIFTAQEHAELNHHVLGPWKPFLGGAIQIALCTICKRHAITEVLPNGNEESREEKSAGVGAGWGTPERQLYKTDIRGSAITMECGGRKVD